MLSYNDLIVAFEKLGLQDKHVIAHASLSSFGNLMGGGDSIVTALDYGCASFIMPCHTYKTMVTPASGPANNAINYQRGQQWNRLAEPFHKDMAADALMGVVPESMRKWPEAYRSSHPILSFIGIRARKTLEKQTLDEPFAPVKSLVEQDGWVLLLGVDHTANSSIHFAEKLAGRKQFVRWALSEAGTVTCPGFPGCSLGFEAIEPQVRGLTRTIAVGEATIKALPLRGLMVKVIEAIKKDRFALLCNRPDCERCADVRKSQ